MRPSTPNAGDPTTSLAPNTTAHLITDIERLRAHLGIPAWDVAGLSWGSTLGLAYAQRHPERLTAMALGMVVTGTRREIEWITRDMGRLVPQAWERFRDGVPEHDRDSDLADPYTRRLESDDPQIREQAAIDWCTGEPVRVEPLAARRRSAVNRGLHESLPEAATSVVDRDDRVQQEGMSAAVPRHVDELDQSIGVSSRDPSAAVASEVVFPVLVEERVTEALGVQCVQFGVRDWPTPRQCDGHRLPPRIGGMGVEQPAPP